MQIFDKFNSIAVKNWAPIAQWQWKDKSQSERKYSQRSVQTKDKMEDGIGKGPKGVFPPQNILNT